MELRIKETEFPKVIEFNFEELKAEISAKAALYKNMVYTDDNIKEAKADKAALNKFIAALEDKRKEVKKQCLQPYEAFENQMKNLVAIVNEPVMLIDSQIKDYEDKKKAEKLEQIKGYWESTDHPEWVMCKKIFDQRWLNTSFSLKKVKEAIDERLVQIASDIKTLESLQVYSFEAIETYKQTLDLNRAIAEGQRLADIQRRKEEAAKVAAEAARQAEAQLQAETVTEQVTPPQAEPEIIEHPARPARQWIGFEAYLSVDEAKALRAFFNQFAIDFRMIQRKGW